MWNLIICILLYMLGGALTSAYWNHIIDKIGYYTLRNEIREGWNLRSDEEAEKIITCMDWISLYLWPIIVVLRVGYKHWINLLTKR